MPASLKNDADWAFFQSGLDAADVCVLGRVNHEASPNPKRRRRLVLTRSVTSIQRDGDIVFWNPARNSMENALAQFDVEVSHLAVVGGQAVFDFFLAAPYRYTRFHLSRIAGVLVPGGRVVFAGMEYDSEESAKEGAKVSAEDILKKNGFEVVEQIELDQGVDVASWG